MKDRFKELRKELKLSQTAFADKTNLSRSYVYMIEAGERVPADKTVIDICRTFGVSEDWLRNGEGAMFAENSDKVRLYAWAMDTLTGGDPFLIRLLDELSKLPPEQIEAVKEFLKRVIDDREGGVE